jgi:hypothetical protein
MASADNEEVDLTGDNSPEPVRQPRRSSGAGVKRPRSSGSVAVQLDDGSTAKRSLRIAKLEGEAQRKAVEVELEKEKQQQMMLHGRIASLLKKVEYMDKRRSEAEDKLAATKAAARAAKTNTTGGTLEHLSEINAKDKEIAKLKKAMKGAGAVKSEGSPKKLETQVKQLQAKLDKEAGAKAKQVEGLESKLQKAQDEVAKLKAGAAPRSSPKAASSGDADVRCPASRPACSPTASNLCMRALKPAGWFCVLRLRSEWPPAGQGAEKGDRHTERREEKGRAQTRCL